MCLLLSSCGNGEKLSVGTPEYVYATYYSGPDVHDWELSQDEIDDWVVWLNNLTISPINLEESKGIGLTICTIIAIIRSIRLTCVWLMGWSVLHIMAMAQSMGICVWTTLGILLKIRQKQSRLNVSIQSQHHTFLGSILP